MLLYAMFFCCIGIWRWKLLSRGWQCTGNTTWRWGR